MCGRFTFQPTEAIYARFQLSNRLDALVPPITLPPVRWCP
jgi:hypothetical protein